MKLSLADLDRSVQELLSAAEKFDQDPETAWVEIRFPAAYNAGQIEAKIGGMRIIQAIRHQGKEEDSSEG
jgi:hypothetical protein